MNIKLFQTLTDMFFYLRNKLINGRCLKLKLLKKNEKRIF